MVMEIGNGRKNQKEILEGGCKKKKRKGLYQKWYIMQTSPLLGWVTGVFCKEKVG